MGSQQPMGMDRQQGKAAPLQGRVGKWGLDALHHQRVLPPAGTEGLTTKISKTNVCQSRSCWEEPGLQEQLGVCDTEMSPANFRGAELRRKDILLELSVDFLA